MNILEIENRYNHLKEFLAENFSKRSKLLKLSEFFSILLSFENQNQLEAYISEFIHPYFSLIKDFEIRGINPNRIEALRNQLFELKKLSFLKNHSSEIDEALSLLEDKLLQSDSWLRNNKSTNPKNIIYFPVLEHNQSGIEIGYLETLYIEIRSGENKFHITPAEFENDAQLEKQSEICWNSALKFCRTFVKKIKSTHTVNLHFENRLGIYIGNSLGIALTLAFIEAILKHYNSKTIVRINGCIAVTGGIDNNSKIISTSKAIIETKVETVFFSDVQIFCVPKIDELWAEEKLFELKKIYPNRNLKIIGLTDLEDLLSRRNVVDIRKQKLVIRVGKFVRKNWISAVATVFLAIIFSYLLVVDFDYNPDSFYGDGNNIYFLNKKGRKLWSYSYLVDKYVYSNQNALKYYVKLKDIDDDGINEIFYIETEKQNSHRQTSQSMLIGIKNLNDTLWTYTFSDSVSSERETLSIDYSLSIIDFIRSGDKDVIICWAQNTTSFANAVFLIDVKTGKRIYKTHWVSGHIIGGMLLDLNHDSREDLLLTGIDNGYEEAVIWGVEFDQLDGYRPTIQSYVIKDKKESETIFYIRIPKLDYEKFMGFRSSGIDFGSLTYLANHDLIRCVTLSYQDRSMSERLPLMDYRLKSNLKDFDIYVSSPFRVVRDSLVAKGFLKEPFTDTHEYIELQKSKILYWQNGKWVNRYGEEKK